MVLRIDEAELRARLFEHKEQIGFGPIANGVVIIIEGLFYIPAALTSGLDQIFQGLLLALSIIFIFYGVWSLITACRNKYDAITLYEDIANMDRTERRSSIIAVKDANRYLLYRDLGWGCDFFPNHATASSTDEDVRQLTTYFADEFGIPAKDFTLSHICVKDSEKPSTEHDGEVRYYEYTLYRASVTVMPDAWRSTEFHVGAKDCRWMTLDEMLADPGINKINHDVVAMVRDNL